jgi:hypothetical protein
MTPTAHIVLAHYNEDLAWTSLLQFPFTVVSRAGIAAGVWPNKGREASAYLEWLIANYAELPDYAVFLHAHQCAWHCRLNMTELLRDTVFSQDYWNLNDERCLVIGARPYERDITTKIGAELEPILGCRIPVDKLVLNCCAQFYVSRDAIRRHPVMTYQRLFDWLRDTNHESQQVAYVFEYLWHFIFTGNPVDCRCAN